MSEKRRIDDFEWMQKNIVEQIPEESLIKTPQLKEGVEKFNQLMGRIPLPTVSKRECDNSHLYQNLSFAKFNRANDRFLQEA